MALAFAACAAAAGEANWQPPAQPKDDQHWYPEIPELEKPLDALANGSFEEAAPEEAGCTAAPKSWAHPDGLTSFWSAEPAHGKVIVLDTDVYEVEAKKRQAQVREAREKKTPVPEAAPKAPVKEQYSAIGATYGVSFYSQPFACKPKQAYKISFDFKGPGGGAKVWVRGWGPLGGEIRRRWETTVECGGQAKSWTHLEQAFHPTRRPLSKEKVTFIEISYLRVMLYAFWPRGKYAFDNVKIDEISDEEYEKMKNPPEK